MRTSILLALLGLVAFVTAVDINAIVKYNGKRLAFDGYDFLGWPDTTKAHAYEVTGTHQTNTYSMSHPNTSAILESSIVIGDTLYQFHGAYGLAYLAKYSLPFNTPTITPTHQIKLDNQIQEIPAIFDTTDGIAVAMVSRYLTVITLNPMKAWDSVLAISGSGKTPGSLVYDHKNNKVYYFQADYCQFGYCQRIFEFKANLNTKKLTELDETFTPNYNNNFNKGLLSGCSLDYSHDNIWCLNHAEERLYKFSIANLNTHSFIALPNKTYKKGNVVFDFANHKAYVIATETDGYTVVSVNINNGNTLQQVTFPGNKVVSATLGNSDTLLLGHSGRQMSIVNVDVNPFTATSINLTN